MDLKDLGKFIKKARKEQNISQEELCKDLHISRSTLSSLENARGEVGIKKVLQILDYLNYEITVKEKSPFPTLDF